MRRKEPKGIRIDPTQRDEEEIRTLKKKLQSKKRIKRKEISKKIHQTEIIISEDDDEVDDDCQMID